MCKEVVNVSIEPVIVVGDKKNIYLFGRYETLEQAQEALDKIQSVDDTARGLEVIEGFELVSDHEQKYFDDSMPFYFTEEQAKEHFEKVVKKSHMSEAVDTEGHTYECYLCGFHFYVFDPLLEMEDCKLERVLVAK